MGKRETEVVRQCFLFTNHMLLCTRSTNGKLHLIEVSGFLQFIFLLCKPF